MMLVQTLFEHQQPALVEFLRKHAIENVRANDLVDIREQDQVIGAAGLQASSNAVALIILAFPILFPPVLVDTERRRQFIGKSDLQIDDLVFPRGNALPVLVKEKGLGGSALGLVRFYQNKPVNEIAHFPQADLQKIEFIVENKTVVKHHHQRGPEFV